ncbi:unnamed protein product [Angiostrongylus costaricensis]|uniref:Uncharacterized protein n=1 Tax=Angiostrongylus costaricensis TaxID=334426 RepID=A0A3P7HNL8_ANGCS|nr:unnamed protein product [Angiostrongylus costaricensis]
MSSFLVDFPVKVVHFPSSRFTSIYCFYFVVYAYGDPRLSIKIDFSNDSFSPSGDSLQSFNPDLNELSYPKLVTLTAEMEQLIQVYNESLVDELAHRDELEYEKEMKNTFISLLLSIQNKRRQFVNERKRKGTKIDPLQLPQYMTASIPYNDHQHMDNNTLASLIKILRAINNDSFTVPTLLTNYILTGNVLILSSSLKQLNNPASLFFQWCVQRL